MLGNSDPLRFADVINKANLNYIILKEHLDFLIKQGLVEERTSKKRRVAFTVTQHGIIVLKYFRKPMQELSVME